MLRVESLSKSFDGFQAVVRANLQVNQGEIVAVIGPNGAGKTTLFNLISGIIKPDSGRVLFKGEDITGLPPHKVCRKRMSRSFQVVNVFQRLTVFENVQMAVLSRERKTWNLFTPSSKLALEETDRHPFERWPCGEEKPHHRLALPRRPEGPGDCHGPRGESRALNPRRADRRYGPGRNRPLYRVDQAPV